MVQMKSLNSQYFSNQTPLYKPIISTFGHLCKSVLLRAIPFEIDDNDTSQRPL